MRSSWQDDLDDDEDVNAWTEEFDSFPWWMEEEQIEKQETLLNTKLGPKIDDRKFFTPDFPKLAKEESQFLFVYGTLRKGKTNHIHLSDKRKAVFVSDATTVDDHFIMKQTKSGIPVVLSEYGQNNALACHVRGELYVVKSNYMTDLDAFEQNGNLYVRVKLLVKCSDKVSVPAWTYLGIKKVWAEDRNLILSPSFTSNKGKKDYFHYIGAKG